MRIAQMNAVRKVSLLNLRPGPGFLTASEEMAQVWSIKPEIRDQKLRTTGKVTRFASESQRPSSI